MTARSNFPVKGQSAIHISVGIGSYLAGTVYDGFVDVRSTALFGQDAPSNPPLRIPTVECDFFARRCLTGTIERALTSQTLDARCTERIVAVVPGDRPKDVITRDDQQPPSDPVLWWRNSFQRDQEAFERAHGRRPETWLELSRWLPPIPIRADRRPS